MLPYIPNIVVPKSKDNNIGIQTVKFNVKTGIRCLQMHLMSLCFL